MKNFNTIKIQGKDIRYNFDDEGRAVPMSIDILQLVRIPELSEGLKTIYDFMGNYDSKRLLKWAAYHADLTRTEARNRLLRYFIIDIGLRVTQAPNQTIKNDEWEVGVDWIQTLLDDFTTDKTIQRELEREGFKITLTSL